jgi:WD40-like Beta Propeller Repeat
MKRALEKMILLILNLMMLSSGTIVKDISVEHDFYSHWEQKSDTTELIRLIQVDSFKLAVIPPSSGVQFYKDGIVFLSMSKYENKMSPDHISFGAVEAYYASFVDSILGRHMIFSPVSTFSYPCDAMTFTRDYDTLYFTKFPRKEKKEKIFMAKSAINVKNQTEWISDSGPLDFCNDNSNYTHPTLSADEKMLIFASDKEGSVGGMDLFISRKEGKKWSAPENLGKIINTPGNEFFPYLDTENNLFFSSDGLKGYGGYDIFTCKFNGVGWNKPVNLSGHVNSGNDEIAFTINKRDGKTALFTRRQKSGERDMQLYRVTLKQKSTDHNLLTISNIFNGKPVPMTNLITAGNDLKVKPAEAELPKVKPGIEVNKKDEIKQPETTVSNKKIPGKEAVKKTEPVANQPDAKVVIIKPSVPIPVEQRDVVIYRVQFLTSNKPRVNKEIILGGKSYNLFEYFYLGAYRYTAGEFHTLPLAVELQKICRQSGYPQAFVVAFKNNTRSLDLKLFK